MWVWCVWVSEGEWASESERVSECEWVRVSGPSAIDQHHDLSRQVMNKEAMISWQAINLNELSWYIAVPCSWRAWPEQSRVAETKGRQCVHPTPCRAPSAAPAMQNLPAKRRRPRDARAYIRPLAKQQVLHISFQDCHLQNSRNAARWNWEQHRIERPSRPTNACRCGDGLVNSHRLQSHLLELLGQIFKGRQPYEILSGTDVQDGLTPIQGQKGPTSVAMLIISVKDLMDSLSDLHHWQESKSWSRHISAGTAVGKSCSSTSALLGRTFSRPVSFLLAKTTPGDLLQLITIEPLAGRISASYASSRGPSSLTTGIAIGAILDEAASVFSNVRFEELVLLPWSLALQDGENLTNLVLVQLHLTGKAAETKGRQGVHPTPCRAASAAPATQKVYWQSGGDQGTLDVHPTPCRAASAAPATQKAAETKGRQGVHPTPYRAASAAPATQKPPETKGRQGVHPTPCRAASAAPATQKLPAERRRPRDARRISDPLQSSKCCARHAKVTGRAAETKGRQVVHPTPCRAASAAPATQKAAETKGRQGIHPTPCRVASAAPATQKSNGDQGTPGRTSDPLQSTKCRACHAKATGRAAETGTPGRTSDPLQSSKCCACHAKPTGRAAETKGRQGVHPTPCRAASAAPAMQKAAETKGRQGVHPTPCRAPSAAPATQNLPAKRRRPRDARAYIRPLAEQQVLCPPRKSYRQSGGDQGTPSRTSDPLQSSKCCARHAKSNGDQGTPGRTSDPLQSSKCCACHAKATGRAAETKGRQGVHPTPCRAASAAPATQKAPETKGRQGVHPTPCRAPSAAPATQKNVIEGECVSECEWEWVSEGEWVSESEWVRVSEWVSESEWEWVRVGVSEWEWVRVSVSVRVRVRMWVWVRVRVRVWVLVWVWVWVWVWVRVRVRVRVSEWVR